LTASITAMLQYVLKVCSKFSLSKLLSETPPMSCFKNWWWTFLDQFILVAQRCRSRRWETLRIRKNNKNIMNSNYRYNGRVLTIIILINGPKILCTAVETRNTVEHQSQRRNQTSDFISPRFIDHIFFNCWP